MMNRKYLQMTVFIFLIAVQLIAAQLITAQERIEDPINAPVSAAQMWETAIGDTIKGSPHLQANSAVLAGERGSIRSFFMSGTHLWNFDARGTAVPHIARSYEAATYVCNNAGVFMAINRVGRELWRLNLGKPISYPPVVGWDGRVFVSLESTMTCRTAAGNGLWTIDLGSNVAFAPILDKTGSVATVLQNMDFVKVNQFGNVERIKLQRLPLMIASLNEGALQSYVLLYQSGEMEKITFNGGARAGGKLSKSNIKSLPTSPVAAIGRNAQFVVYLRDGKTLLLDSQGGTVWSKNTHESVEEKGAGNLSVGQASVIWDERGVFALSIRGVSAFTQEGRRRFVHRLSVESSGVPSLSDEGILYACGKDNILRVFRVDAKPRTVPHNKFYGPEPEGTYGMGNPPPSPWVGDNSRYRDPEQDEIYEEMKAVIRSGQIGEKEPIYVAYIMEMVGFFIGNPQTSPVRPLVKPPQRVRLIELLSHVGSRETIPFFWNIFDRDHEPIVRRACADAIGVVGVDPTGRSFYSYNFALTQGNPHVDPQLVLAASSSIARLCRFSGPPLSPEGIRVMRYFSNLPTVPNRVKAQIHDEIDGLFKEGLDKVIQ